MYNNKIEIFPNNIVAGVFKFEPEELYKVESEEAKKAPKVQF